MKLRGLLIVAILAAMAFVVVGMVAPSSRDTGVVVAGAASTDQDASASPQSSLPMLQYDFPDYGFSIQAPEDWRVLTADEQRALTEVGNDLIGSSDTIVALMPDIPNGFETAVVMIDTMLEPMDEESLSTLNTMSLVLTGLDWVSPGSWTGKKWTRVTTSPYGHEIAGYAAASMDVQTKRDEKEAMGRMTIIELPKEAVIMLGIMTDDTFLNTQVAAILASFTAVADN